MDQAKKLRDMVKTGFADNRSRVIAITSGKGGVGKTNITANLAISFHDLEKSVLVFDADVGLANIDILLNLNPKYNLEHVLRGEREMKDIVVKGPSGIDILPSASGVQELSSLTEEQRIVISGEIESLFNTYDIILIDTAAGIASNVTYFCTSADEIAIIATSEPTSITDAYALMKVLNSKYAQKAFKLIVNLVKSEREGKEVYQKLSIVADRFLPYISIEYIGCILLDDKVKKAVQQQTAFIELYPHSKAAICISKLAKRLIDYRPNNLKRKRLIGAI